MHCLLAPKSEPVAELRLDTLSLELTCATCMHKDLVRVSMVGRVMRFRRQHFFLCPSCVSVQVYRGGAAEQIWGADEPCAHRPPPRQAASRWRAGAAARQFAGCLPFLLLLARAPRIVSTLGIADTPSPMSLEDNEISGQSPAVEL